MVQKRRVEKMQILMIPKLKPGVYITLTENGQLGFIIPAKGSR